MLRPLLALALLLLAGCSQAPASAPANEAPGVITDPLDVSSSAAGSHVHDYWQGRDRVTVVDETRDIGLVSYGGDHGPIGFFHPPEGSIVPQGTGVLEATLSWQDGEESLLGVGSAYTRVELWAKTAADAMARFMADAVNGQAVRFNITYDDADPPHYTVSLWEFQAMFWNDGGDQTSFSGTITLQAKAFRTLPLQPFPAHPDLWNGATELLLLEHSGSVEQIHAVLTYACTRGCLPFVGLPNGTVVPHDAREVVVQFTPSPDSTPVPVRLTFHGADTRSFSNATGQPSGGGQVYSIPLKPGMGDSPYALQSLWEFWFRMDTPLEQGAWRGSYELTIKALR
jgi:hypothetical protein